MPQNLEGHVTLATPPFPKILRDRVRTVPADMPVKFEVRSFNLFGLAFLTPKKFSGSYDPGHANFTVCSKIFSSGC